MTPRPCGRRPSPQTSNFIICSLRWFDYASFFHPHSPTFTPPMIMTEWRWWRWWCLNDTSRIIIVNGHNIHNNFKCFLLRCRCGSFFARDSVLCDKSQSGPQTSQMNNGLIPFQCVSNVYGWTNTAEICCCACCCWWCFFGGSREIAHVWHLPNRQQHNKDIQCLSLARMSTEIVSANTCVCVYGTDARSATNADIEHINTWVYRIIFGLRSHPFASYPWIRLKQFC